MKQLKQYCKEIKKEFGKITWLGRKELLKKSAAVFVTSGVLAVLLYGMDSAFKAAIGFGVSLF